MPTRKPTIFQIRNIEIIYKAEFSPPILEIASGQTQIEFLKAICQNFGFKFKEVVLNNQAISSSLIAYRKAFKLGFFEASIGVDELQTVNVNPETEVKAWELTFQTMNLLSKISRISFKRQTLTFNIHCSSESIIFSKFINNINIFEFKNIFYTKGATFSIKSPWPGCLINIILDQSMLVENGLFLLLQTFIDESVQKYDNIFEKTLIFLKQNIEPSLNIKLNYEGRK
jgi:hypothetical protein